MLAEPGIKWDAEAEVLIVGYGGAGAVAAITAHDKGADVLLLEKQEAAHHITSTGMAGGYILCPSSAEDAALFAEALYRVSDELSWTDREVLWAWAKYSAQNKEWLEKTLKSQPKFAGPVAEADFPGRDSLVAYLYRGRGFGLFKALCREIAARKIRVMHQAPARRLLTNPQGEVVGVRAANLSGVREKEMNVRATKAVILTCGGFQFNEAMKLQYLKVYPFYGHGTPASTGDGIKMAQEVGADLWHMSACSGRLMAKFPDFPIAFSLDFDGLRSLARKRDPRVKPAGYLWVDSRGQRFTCEEAVPHYVHYEMSVFDSQKTESPRLPSYWIFDQKRLDMGPLVAEFMGAAGPYHLYRWSQDNRQEIARGWIVQAPTVKELAQKLSLNPDALVKTVRAYNLHCRRGEDAEFGRKPAGLVPLATPPYCAVRLWPGGPTTHGGPRRNARAQVVNVWGNPIPGLYAAGEMGSVYGMLYIAPGGFLAECLAFGRLAGENAAQEKRRQ